MTAQAKKGYKGIGMDGPIATWYAKNTAKNMEDFRKDARKMAEWVPAGGAILEVAPGPGYLSIELAKMGKYTLIGLDISETFVEIARENAKKAGVDVDFRHGNASRMPFSEGRFDAIVCRAAFKNFSEPVLAMNEMYRVLKPGGQASIIDLRGDVTEPEVNTEVEKMGLSGLNKLFTKWAFKFMLIKRAYTKEQFRAFAAQSLFKTCEINVDGIGLEVRLRR